MCRRAHGARVASSVNAVNKDSVRNPCAIAPFGAFALWIHCSSPVAFPNPSMRSWLTTTDACDASNDVPGALASHAASAPRVSPSPSVVVIARTLATRLSARSCDDISRARCRSLSRARCSIVRSFAKRHRIESA